MAGKYVMANEAELYTKSNSTEFKVIGTTGDVYAGAVYFGNSTAAANLAIGADGTLYSKTAPLSYAETLSWSSGGLTPSTATAYSLTHIAMTGTDPSTSPYLLSLAAPIAGIEKTIVLDSTAAYINTIDIDLGAGVRVDGSSDGRFIAFSTLATAPQSIKLVGVSTSAWEVLSVNSTLGGWGLATGIRGSTIARTS